MPRMPARPSASDGKSEYIRVPKGLVHCGILAVRTQNDSLVARIATAPEVLSGCCTAFAYVWLEQAGRASTAETNLK